MKQAIEIRDVRYVVTCDDEDHILQNADVLIRDGKILALITPGERRERMRELTAQGLWEEGTARVIAASGFVMYPGLVNTHHHLYQIFSRNLPAVQNMELFPWLKYLYEIWKNINPDVIK